MVQGAERRVGVRVATTLGVPGAHTLGSGFEALAVDRESGRADGCR